jgi:hypothetical protein
MTSGRTFPAPRRLSNKDRPCWPRLPCQNRRPAQSAARNSERTPRMSLRAERSNLNPCSTDESFYAGQPSNTAAARQLRPCAPRPVCLARTGARGNYSRRTLNSPPACHCERAKQSQPLFRGQVLPLGIQALDKLHLAGTRAGLDPFLGGNSISDTAEFLIKD